MAWSDNDETDTNEGGAVMERKGNDEWKEMEEIVEEREKMGMMIVAVMSNSPVENIDAFLREQTTMHPIDFMLYRYYLIGALESLDMNVINYLLYQEVDLDLREYARDHLMELAIVQSGGWILDQLLQNEVVNLNEDTVDIAQDAATEPYGFPNPLEEALERAIRNTMSQDVTRNNRLIITRLVRMGVNTSQRDPTLVMLGIELLHDWGEHELENEFRRNHLEYLRMTVPELFLYRFPRPINIARMGMRWL